jgi:hypothetical protein
MRSPRFTFAHPVYCAGVDTALEVSTELIVCTYVAVSILFEVKPEEKGQ